MFFPWKQLITLHLNFSHAHSVGKYYKKRSRFLRKNQHFFRQINALVKKLLKSWFHGNFFARSSLLIFFTLWRSFYTISLKLKDWLLMSWFHEIFFRANKFLFFPLRKVRIFTQKDVNSFFINSALILLSHKISFLSMYTLDS